MNGQPGAKRGVLLFPPDMQMMGPPPHERPPVRSPFMAKLLSRARRTTQAFLHGVFAPVTNYSALFSFLIIPFFIFFTLVFAGKKGFQTEVVSLGAWIFAAVAAFPVWILVSAAFAPFRAISAERSLGHWRANRFVFHEPRHAATIEWSPDDNGKALTFEFRDAEAGALLDYKIEVDGAASRINCIVFGANFFRPADEVLKHIRFATHGRVVLKKNRTLQLLCYSEPSTLRSTIRVYILGWEVDPSVLLDYTDLRTNTRFVMSPP